MDSVQLDGAAAMRVLAHPLRPRLLAFLRRNGSSTATQLAREFGLSSGDTSYHLRQLARHGLIEEDASRGSRRERWWQAAAGATSFDPKTLSRRSVREAMRSSQHVRLAMRADEIDRALLHPGVPGEWREAFSTNDFLLELTVDELGDLLSEVAAVVAKHTGKAADGAERRRFHLVLDAVLLVEEE